MANLDHYHCLYGVTQRLGEWGKPLTLRVFRRTGNSLPVIGHFSFYSKKLEVKIVSEKRWEKAGNAKTDFKPDPSLLEGAKFHDNINQIYIRTTEDKLRESFKRFQRKPVYYNKSGAFRSEFRVISLGATLLTTTFAINLTVRQVLGSAVHVCFFIASALDLVVSIELNPFVVARKKNFD